MHCDYYNAAILNGRYFVRHIQADAKVENITQKKANLYTVTRFSCDGRVAGQTTVTFTDVVKRDG